MANKVKTAKNCAEKTSLQFLQREGEKTLAVYTEKVHTKVPIKYISRYSEH